MTKFEMVTVGVGVVVKGVVGNGYGGVGDDNTAFGDDYVFVVPMVDLSVNHGVSVMLMQGLGLSDDSGVKRSWRQKRG